MRQNVLNAVVFLFCCILFRKQFISKIPFPLNINIGPQILYSGENYGSPPTLQIWCFYVSQERMGKGIISLYLLSRCLSMLIRGQNIVCFF